MNRLVYQKGSKYIVQDKFTYQTGITGHFVMAKNIVLTLSGRLVIEPGYMWEGPPKFVIDTPDLRRASLVYDVLYRLMKDALIPYSLKNDVNDVLIRMCKEDGMGSIRRWWIRRVIGLFETQAFNVRKPSLFSPEK